MDAHEGVGELHDVGAVDGVAFVVEGVEDDDVVRGGDGRVRGPQARTPHCERESTCLRDSVGRMDCWLT